MWSGHWVVIVIESLMDWGWRSGSGRFSSYMSISINVIVNIFKISIGLLPTFM